MDGYTFAGGFAAFIAIVFGLITTIFWMVVGWRAMIAHENIARFLERMQRQQDQQP